MIAGLEQSIARGGERGSVRGIYRAELVWQAFLDSLWKFDPRVEIRNPVMFVVWLGAWVTAAWP